MRARAEAPVGMKTLVAHGRLVAERRVPPARVVPTVDVVEQRAASLGGRAEPRAIEQLTLERGKEALAEGVVVGVAHRAHRQTDAEGQAALPVGDSGVLAAVIGLVDDAVGPALR